MRILRIYLLKEMLQPTGMALVLFTFILLIGNLVQLANLLINKGMPVIAVIQMFGLLIPTLLLYTIPMAALTGTLLAFGKLSSDREILAMRTSGISLFSLAVPILLVGFTLSCALIIINDRVVPWSHYATRQLVQEIGVKNPTAFLEAGTFIKEFKPYILFVYQIDKNKMRKIRIYEPQENRPTRTILADSGEFIPIPEQQQVQLKLFHGTADEPDPRDPSRFYKLAFASYTMNLALNDGKNSKGLGRKPKDMTLEMLKDEEQKLNAQGIDTTPLQTEAYGRIAMAFSPFFFILLGLPLGITTQRGQRSAGLGLSVLIFVGYYLFIVLGQALAQKGLVPAGIALWMGNIIFFIAGILCFWNAYRR